MSQWMAIVVGVVSGILICVFLLSWFRSQRLIVEYQQYIHELKLQHQQEIENAKKRSVNTSRAVLKGKMAEQLAPLFPEFEYLPSDAKFLGDPVDYIIFDGYHAFREGEGKADEITVVLMDIKSGNARLSKGQRAISEAIRAGRVRFEMLHVDFSDT